MAHHNSTPRTVLDAPRRTFTALVIHEGANRHERRHEPLVAMKLAGITNSPPYASTKVRKVRHGRKARWNR